MCRLNFYPEPIVHIGPIVQNCVISRWTGLIPTLLTTYMYIHLTESSWVSESSTAVLYLAKQTYWNTPSEIPICTSNFLTLLWLLLAQQAPGLYLSHHSHYNWPKGNEWSSFMLPFWCLAACSGHVVLRPNWFFSGLWLCRLWSVWCLRGVYHWARGLICSLSHQDWGYSTDHQSKWAGQWCNYDVW